MFRFLRSLAALLLVLCGGLSLATPAAAAQARVCWAALDAAESAADAVAKVRKWDCEGRGSTLSNARVAARLPVPAGQAETGYTLRAGIGQFDRLTLVASGADGRRVVRDVLPDAAVPSIGAPFFTVPLPVVARPQAFYVVVDHPGSTYITRQMRLVANASGGASASPADALLLAVLAGMLIIPLLLDLGVYTALRKPFFLWHALLIGNFILLLLCWSGLAAELLGLSMPAWHRLLMLSIGFNGVVACLFSRSYTAASRLSRALDQSLLGGALYSGALMLALAAGLFDGSVARGNLYSTALVPVLLLLLVNLYLIARNGGRQVRMQLLGWAPLILFFVARYVSDRTGAQFPYGALPLLYAGVLILSVLSAVGVILRFADMRRERDMAVARAEVMGGLAERDHLTGLLNRRAIDNRFAALRAKGYDTFALIDLDHFKAINDVSGHSVGDRVLEVTARVLASDADNIAVRLGGEEFLVLLRGANPKSRAEKLRRMLSVRVAREVDGLEQIVTASMGLLTLPADRPDALAFGAVYSRADLLLYQAKREGRNRTKAAQWDVYLQADGAASICDHNAMEQPAVA